MPQGKGTYGSKVGRPRKKSVKARGKCTCGKSKSMPKCDGTCN